MRLSKSLVLIVAAAALAAPAFADPPAQPPSHTGAGKAEKQAKREARLLEAMKKQGISDAKAKNVVAVMKSFRVEMRRVKQDLKSAKAQLRQNENDKAAHDRMQAAKQKLQGIKQRRSAALAKILSPAELEKLKPLIERGKRHGKGHKDGKGKA